MSLSKATSYRKKRAADIENARKLLDHAQSECRELTGEENQQYDRFIASADRYLKDAERYEKLEAAEASLDQSVGRRSSPVDGEARERRHHEGPSGDGSPAAQMDGYRHWLRSGQVRSEIRSLTEVSGEMRDTIIGTDAKGGFLIAPVQVSRDIVRAVDAAVHIRRVATISKVTEAKALGVRKKVTRMDDANWTSEVASVTEDTSLAFGRRDLTPQLMSKLAKVSLKTLYLAPDAEKEVNDELIYKFSVTEEKAYMTGDGSGKPLGVFVADNNGIPASRDVTTASVGTITADDLIDLKFNLKEGYLNDPSTRWGFHQSLQKVIHKMKDGNGQYIWQPGLQAGSPDRLLEIPYITSEFAPSTLAGGTYAAVLGAFSYYRIAEIEDVMIQRLVELYAATNEIGFIGRRWVDGGPMLDEAFTRLKVKAA